MVRLRRGAGLVRAIGLALMLVALAGCGDHTASDGPSVTLLITRDFGRQTLAHERLPLASSSTAMKLLEHNHEVDKSDDGFFVEAIDSLRARPHTSDGENETLWAVYVNGIETDVPTAQLPLAAGDLVHFDLRDYYVTLDVRATVGGYPQTFVHGMLGRRFPVSVRCAVGYHVACGEVRRKLRQAGIEPSGADPDQQPLRPALRRWREMQATVRRAVFLVGPWYRWRNRPWPRRLERGPRFSGVFARPGRDTLSMRLLDWNARRLQTLRGEVGLLAAMRPTEEDLVWFVTGINLPGVEKAAHALTPQTLRGAYAVIATDAGVTRIPLPPTRAQ